MFSSKNDLKINNIYIGINYNNIIVKDSVFYWMVLWPLYHFTHNKSEQLTISLSITHITLICAEQACPLVDIIMSVNTNEKYVYALNIK